MTVKEYANKMGLTVNGLCEVTGMSRMGLYPGKRLPSGTFVEKTRGSG